MRYPVWLKKKTPKSLNNKNIRSILGVNGIHTVCESALCPNRGECFEQGTLTFMILGNNCTRACTFCAVRKGAPAEVDPGEPDIVAAAAERLVLKHVVITSVTRDDLPDGGAEQFAKTITAVRKKLPKTTIEVLIPDFLESLEIVLNAKPDVLNHNIETIERLYSAVRPHANFQRSLNLLNKASGLVKSGFMVGLGENDAEVKDLLMQLKSAGVDIVTIGQYIAPSKEHYPIQEFVHPEKFAEYKEYAEKELGIKYVFAGPLVRSSYLAETAFKTVC